MTPEVVKKLEEAFALGCTDLEACFYADISKQTLYNYQELHPEFVDRKEKLKDSPVLLARTNVVQAIRSGDADLAKWYLERKRKEEFSPRSEVDSTINLKGLPAVSLAGAELNFDVGNSVE